MRIKNLVGVVIYEDSSPTYRESVEAAVRKGVSLAGARLRLMSLAGAELVGADLRGADLTETNLSDTDLYQADLSKANLSEANLLGADLRRADLREAVFWTGWKIVLQGKPETGEVLSRGGLLRSESSQ